MCLESAKVDWRTERSSDWRKVAFAALGFSGGVMREAARGWGYSSLVEFSVREGKNGRWLCGVFCDS